MIPSLYAGVSGHSTNSTAMAVIGDNIANVNTTAFKRNRSEFANTLSTSLGGESAMSEVGRGVDLWSVNAQWTQGSLENTASNTDLAINGKGFFIVQEDGGTNYYTRPPPMPAVRAVGARIASRPARFGAGSIP